MITLFKKKKLKPQPTAEEKLATEIALCIGYCGGYAKAIVSEVTDSNEKKIYVMGSLLQQELTVEVSAVDRTMSATEQTINTEFKKHAQYYFKAQNIQEFADWLDSVLNQLKTA